MDASSREDNDFDAWAARRKAKKKGEKEKEEGDSRGNKNKVEGERQALHGFYRRAGISHRCLKRDSEYRLAPN